MHTSLELTRKIGMCIVFPSSIGLHFFTVYRGAVSTVDSSDSQCYISGNIQLVVDTDVSLDVTLFHSPFDI